MAQTVYEVYNFTHMSYTKKLHVLNSHFDRLRHKATDYYHSHFLKETVRAQFCMIYTTYRDQMTFRMNGIMNSRGRLSNYVFCECITVNFFL